jgi:uncharacterized protein (TIGR02444 family)
VAGPTELPSSPVWRFSLELYARPGVAAACLALQDRHGADVNLVLLALWLGICGHRLAPAEGARLARLARYWQRPIVRPLRRVRRRLKQQAAGGLPWPEPVEHWRRRLAEVELALEQVEQLLLERAVGPVAVGPACATAARDNLHNLGLTSLLGTDEARLLLDRTFAVPEGTHP